MTDGPKENTHIRLEFVGGKSAKFWEITVEGSSHTVRYGRLGADSRSLTKAFDSPKEAEASAARRAAEEKGWASR